MRILIVVTHLLGIGHLSRAAALGRAFLAAGHQVRLISGGRPAPAIDLSLIDLVELPPLHVTGTDFATMYRPDGTVADATYLDARRAMLVRAATDFRPDAVITELFPFGRRPLRGEFLTLIAALRRPPFETALCCSIRDVLMAPATDEKLSRTLGWAGLYDLILCHSDPAIMPLSQSWPVDEGLARRLEYTGYVGDRGQEAAASRAGIVVSGGGSAAALPLLRAALGAAAGDGRNWRLLVGHGLPEAAFSALVADATSNVRVERARPDFPLLLRQAACSVSQFGYNTALDIAAAGVPAVVVPFDEGKETEQAVRARRFAELGLVEHLPAAVLDAQTLLAAVDRAMARPAPQVTLALDGAAHSVTEVEAVVARKRTEAARWRRLLGALDAAAQSGRHIRLWWRDDDATAPSVALDRLLSLSERHDAALALAVIPDRVEEGLARRLSGESRVAVLVHGISHRNRAEAGAKKQELVAADGPTLTGLTRGRIHLAAMFETALPVLVPPWNRVAPSVLEALPGLGFAGWSGFSKRLGGQEAALAGDQLCTLHTHIDVMDWRGGGLAAMVPMLERLADLIDAQGPDELPIGLLTHHLVHDLWVWAFMDDLMDVLTTHPAARFVDARAAFALTAAHSGGRQAG